MDESRPKWRISIKTALVLTLACCAIVATIRATILGENLVIVGGALILAAILAYFASKQGVAAFVCWFLFFGFVALVLASLETWSGIR